MSPFFLRTLPLAILLSFIWLHAVESWAAQVAVASVERVPGGVRVDVEAEGLFSEQSLDLLHRGFTAVVRYTVELWGTRGNWFDQFLVRRQATIWIEYDLMETWYRVTREVAGQETSSRVYEELNDALASASLFYGVNLPLPPTSSDSGRCYVAAWVECRALTTQDMKDMGRWLEGLDASGTEEKRDSSWLMETFLRLAGELLASKHAQKAQVQSEPFLLSALPAWE
ncbi:MAG: DUF4390 domain-containing protein [Candidatus Latescibacterota bacterium]